MDNFVGDVRHSETRLHCPQNFPSSSGKRTSFPWVCSIKLSFREGAAGHSVNATQEVFNYILKKSGEYSDSVASESFKSRTDRHESDT
jgi:hypothetical protein